MSGPEAYEVSAPSDLAAAVSPYIKGCDCKTPAEAGTLHGYTCAGHRALCNLADELERARGILAVAESREELAHIYDGWRQALNALAAKERECREARVHLSHAHDAHLFGCKAGEAFAGGPDAGPCSCGVDAFLRKGNPSIGLLRGLDLEAFLEAWISYVQKQIKEWAPGAARELRERTLKELEGRPTK